MQVSRSGCFAHQRGSSSTSHKRPWSRRRSSRIFVSGRYIIHSNPPRERLFLQIEGGAGIPVSAKRPRPGLPERFSLFALLFQEEISNKVQRLSPVLGSEFLHEFFNTPHNIHPHGDPWTTESTPGCIPIHVQYRYLLGKAEQEYSPRLKT